jgi:hypothetical protein
VAAKRLYDWDDLMSRGEFVLTKGEDFSCSFSGMSQQVRQAASKLGVHVAIIELENGIKVTIARRKQDATDQ